MDRAKKIIPIVIVAILLIAGGIYVSRHVGVVDTSASVYGNTVGKATLTGKEGTPIPNERSLEECIALADLFKVGYKYVNGKCYLLKELQVRPDAPREVASSTATTSPEQKAIPYDNSDPQDYMNKKICGKLGGVWKWIKFDGVWTKACELLAPRAPSSIKN